MSEAGAKTLDNLSKPELAALVRKIDTMPQNAQIESAGRAFEGQAKSHPFKLGEVNAQLKNNPALSGKITDLLSKDPVAFEKALPGIFESPDNTSKLIDGALKVANAKTGVDPVVVAAGTDDKVEPAKPEAAKAGEPEYQSKVYPKKPAAAAAAPAVAGETLAAKMARLQKVDGYDQLMARVAKNPDLNKMMTGMMTSGTDAEKGKTLDEILARTKQDPQMLNNLVKTIDERPGLVSTLAAKYAGDPKTGMERLGMYSQGGFGAFMADIAEGKMSAVLEQIRNVVGGMLGGSANFMVMNNGNKMDQFMDAMKANGAAPVKNGIHSVVAVDYASGQTSDVTDMAEKKRAQSSAPAPTANTPAAQPTLTV